MSWTREDNHFPKAKDVGNQGGLYSLLLFSSTSSVLQLLLSFPILAGCFLILILPLCFFSFAWALVPFHLFFHECLLTSLETLYQSH